MCTILQFLYDSVLKSLLFYYIIKKSFSQGGKKMDRLYKNKRKWNQMSLINIAKAGIFSSDRSIREYAENIWDIKPVE